MQNENKKWQTMTKKITNSFSLLAETDNKLSLIADGTYLRWKGNVIDLAVSELAKSIVSGAHSTLVKPGKEQFVKDLGCEASK